MSIDVIADTVCPWCYLGERRLGRALAARPGLSVALRWWPFQLNPGMPARGMDRREYLERKFGGPDAAARVYGAIDEAGRAEGVDWHLDRIRRTPNTLDSHRLILWAAEQGRHMALAHALFEAFFRDGLDIGEPAVLVQAAQGVGLDGDAARALLAGPEGVDAVRARDADARRLGVGGVPCYILGGTEVLGGAQPPEAFLACLDRLAPQSPSP